MQQLFSQPAANTFALTIYRSICSRFCDKEINIHTIVQRNFIAGKFFTIGFCSCFLLFFSFFLLTCCRCRCFLLVRPWNLFRFHIKTLHTLIRIECEFRCETKYPAPFRRNLFQSGNIIWTANQPIWNWLYSRVFTQCCHCRRHRRLSLCFVHFFGSFTSHSSLDSVESNNVRTWNCNFIDLKHLATQSSQSN